MHLCWGSRLQLARRSLAEIWFSLSRPPLLTEVLGVSVIQTIILRKHDHSVTVLSRVCSFSLWPGVASNSR